MRGGASKHHTVLRVLPLHQDCSAELLAHQDVRILGTPIKAINVVTGRLQMPNQGQCPDGKLTDTCSIEI